MIDMVFPSNFYVAAVEDNRIGATHISMYMALLYLHNQNGLANPVSITRGTVMELAKISRLAFVMVSALQNGALSLGDRQRRLSQLVRWSVERTPGGMQSKHDSIGRRLRQGT